MNYGNDLEDDYLYRMLNEGDYQEVRMPGLDVPYLVTTEGMVNEKPVTPKITKTRVDQSQY